MDTQNDPPVTNPETDPRVTLRADLWRTMNISELSRQQEICIDRINALYSIMGSVGTPSMVTIFNALQNANQHLTNLINFKSQSNKPRDKKRNGKG